MVKIVLTEWALFIGWICFNLVWIGVISYLDYKKFYMPPIYVIAGIIFAIVTALFIYVD